MKTSKKRSLAFNSGSPKSPRVLQDPKSDSTAADRGSPPTDGPHNRASPNQAQRPTQSPSFTQPRTPELHVGSIHLAVAAAPRNSPRVPPQSAVPGPDAAATPSGPHRREVGATSRPPPPASGITTVSATADWCTPPSPQADPLSMSTPPPSHACRSSSAFSLAVQSQMPGDSSDRSKRSYAAVVKCPAKPNKCQNHDIILSKRLFDYLLINCQYFRCTISSETTVTHIHKEPIITMRKTESSDLKIVEEHLEEHDPELAYHLFNSQGRFKAWLYPAVSQYLISKGIANNAVRGMNATFYTIPHRCSTKTLEDFLQEQGPLVSMKSVFYGNFELCVASDIGIMLIHGFLVYILNIHKQGHTWNGRFSTGDMEVENCFKCRITKISKQGTSHCRAADLHRFAEIFKPMFTINEEMALYFDVLQKDLRKVSNVEVESELYREYLVSHPALKSSIARYNLECGLHHAASFSSEDGLVRSILRKHNRWKQLIPRETTKGTPGTVLYEVYYYKHDPSKDLDPYAPTVGGLLSYKRNLLQHGHEYIKAQDHTEVEQFAAKTFSQALPNIVWELLSHHKMNGPFKDHWEAYCSSRVGNDGNTEGRISLKEHIDGRTGISISFCEDRRAGGRSNERLCRFLF